MRQTSKDGKTWVDVNAKGSMIIGFTKTTIEQLSECWHMLPASSKTLIKEGQPLLSVETNDGLSSIASPVTGIITFFDNNAMNFPDYITEETIICTLESEEAVKTQKAKQQTEANALAIDFERARMEARQRLIAQGVIPPAPGDVVPVGNVAAGAIRNWGFANEPAAPVARAQRPVRVQENQFRIWGDEGDRR